MGDDQRQGRPGRLAAAGAVVDLELAPHNQDCAPYHPREDHPAERHGVGADEAQAMAKPRRDLCRLVRWHDVRRNCHALPSRSGREESRQVRVPLPARRELFRLDLEVGAHGARDGEDAAAASGGCAPGDLEGSLLLLDGEATGIVPGGRHPSEHRDQAHSHCCWLQGGALRRDPEAPRRRVGPGEPLSVARDRRLLSSARRPPQLMRACLRAL
mmetsp:Transcript_109111/g.315235  ORF Transcript_109111/g.315235 Transcript_109111/m.315235 type:complete len:214 (-) Transcript_109111:137-778(-)